MPKRSSIGASASTSPIAEAIRIGDDISRIPSPAPHALQSSAGGAIHRQAAPAERWEPYGQRFEMTAQPAAANFGSISRAIAVSTLAKIIFSALSGSAGIRIIFATRSGSGVSSRHLAASPPAAHQWLRPRGLKHLSGPRAAECSVGRPYRSRPKCRLGTCFSWP